MKTTTPELHYRFSAAVLLTLMAVLQWTPVKAQDLTYQDAASRQICALNDEQVVEAFTRPDGDGGVFLPIGTEVIVQDVAFDADTELYFRVEYPTGQGLERGVRYIRADQTRNSCNFVERQRQTLNRFTAPPNTCHLIAASRRTVAEVNAFAATYLEYLPSMMVYRADNGWYAVSLGLIPTSRVPFLLANTTRIPPDAYCSDGAGYVDVLDRDRDLFRKIDRPEDLSVTELRQLADNLQLEARETGRPETFRRACDLGAADSCAGYANTMIAADTDAAIATRNRYDLLACMGGVPAGCNNAFTGIDHPFLDHAMRTALRDRRIDAALSIIPELARIGCDMTYPSSCRQVFKSSRAAAESDPGIFSTAVAAAYNACLTGSVYDCREFNDLFGMKRTWFDEGLSASDHAAVGARWDAICSHLVAQNANNRCDAGYRAFSYVLWAPDAADAQIDHAQAFLKKGCDRGNATACASLSRPESGGTVDDRTAAGRAAIVACKGDDAASKACDDLTYYTDDALIPADTLAMTRFDEMAQGCFAGSPYDCGRALSHYAREVSNDDIGPVIAMLRDNCTTERVTGCEALARAYGRYQNSSAAGTITIGIDDPVLRMATLASGCGDLMAPGNTCNDLGNAIAKRGDVAAASDAYDKGCEYILGLGADQVGYREDWDCYDAAKHALLVAKDYPTALRYFTVICDGDTAGLAPYGCKYLGRIHDEGLGVARNAQIALGYLAQSCFHGRVDDSDGEGCYFYGRMLIRDRVAIAGADRDPQDGVVVPDSIDQGEVQYVLEEASLAFQQGCATRIPLACDTNTDLLIQRLDGDFGFQTTNCFVRDIGSTSDVVQTCRSVTQFPNVADVETRPDPLRETIFVWPDGERTVLQQAGQIWRLNGNRTSGLVQDQSHDCIANPATGREFCAQLMTR